MRSLIPEARAGQVEDQLREAVLLFRAHFVPLQSLTADFDLRACVGEGIRR
jgi:hypothetical protein